jgi:acyl-CoA thioesterase-2
VWQRDGVSFRELITLAPADGDRFVATGPRYPWGVLYGGQVIAQALKAAGETVRRDEHVHSLHAYYLRAGSDSESIELEVERVRDGRSFSARSVTARQSGKVIATMLASFHLGEEGEERPNVRPPDTPHPRELTSGGWTSLIDRRFAPIPEPGRALAWLRFADELGPDPHSQACALTFAADDIFDDAVLALLHPERPPVNDLGARDWSISTQSLDYSVWFHRPVSSDGWRLHDYRCQALAGACATVVGEVFDASGQHLATVAQQMLVRRVVARHTGAARTLSASP